jgi:hypothetical protein
MENLLFVEGLDVEKLVLKVHEKNYFNLGEYRLVVSVKGSDTALISKTYISEAVIVLEKTLVRLGKYRVYWPELTY